MGLLSWLFWWFHGCLFMPKLIKLHKLDICGFRCINYVNKATLKIEKKSHELDGILNNWICPVLFQVYMLLNDWKTGHVCWYGTLFYPYNSFPTYVYARTPTYHHQKTSAIMVLSNNIHNNKNLKITQHSIIE